MEITGEKYLINKSLVLYGLADKFDFLVNLFNSEKNSSGFTIKWAKRTR